MTKHLHNEVVKLKKIILHLTAMVEESLMAAVRSVTDRNAELAQRVIDQDTAIDEMEVEVEEECLKILALHQPVAIDLRFIIAVMKINNDLERIGDLAVNIAGRAKALSLLPVRDVPFDLRAMLSSSVKMVERSSDALVKMDAAIAHEVCKADDEIDAMHEAAFAAVQEEICRYPKASEYYINLLSVARNLERIADHATNIAEDVIYMVEGEIVRHRGLDRS